MLESFELKNTAKDSSKLHGFEEGQDIILDIVEEEELQYISSISMITSPVDYRIIRTEKDYAAFKKTAKGSFPAVDFNKQAFLILESQDKMPDNIFEIAAVRQENGGTVVDYRVNIIGLRIRPQSHTYQVIDKNISKVTLNQIL